MSEIISSLRDEHPMAKRSETLAMIRRAIREGWAVPTVWKQVIPVEIYKILEDPGSSRGERLRAAEVIMQMDAKNIDMLIEADRIERLEAGESTSNERVRVEFVNRINADH